MKTHFLRTVVVVVLFITSLAAFSTVAQAAPRFSGPAVLVDISQAGRLPVSKAISNWNAGLTAFHLQSTNSCSGPGCIHVQEVFNGPTFLCTSPYGCSSSGGLTDGSCTVQIDKGAISKLSRQQYGKTTNVVMSILLHEMGHAITGVWRTDGSMGYDCVGLSHNEECLSVMQNPLGLCGILPSKPSTLDYQRANAVYAGL